MMAWWLACGVVNVTWTTSRCWRNGLLRMTNSFSLQISDDAGD
jgi:hypothetical protein